MTAIATQTPPTFIVIFGPQAVGKMTVGQELSRLTGFPFLHNHATIELLLPLFAHGTPAFLRLSREIRRQIFVEAVAADAPGFIFSCVWDFADPREQAEIDDYCRIFRGAGWRVAFVELAASLQTRLVRNRTPLRLLHKPSKRDRDASEQRLLRTAHRRFNSDGAFPYPEEHLLIGNETLPPDDVAERIIACFDLCAAATQRPV